MNLTDEIKIAKEREKIAAWDAAEQRLAKELNLPPQQQLSADVRARLDGFNKWCGDKGVRRLPCKPWVVAAFIRHQAALGVPVQHTLAILAALEQTHDFHTLANPVRTAVVRAAVGEIVKSEPPRSWRKDEVAEWALLPPDVRAAVSRREKERDAVLRRLQNETADLRKRNAIPVEIAEKGNEKCLSENVTTA